jgi:hypothetical protein
MSLLQQSRQNCARCLPCGNFSSSLTPKNEKGIRPASLTVTNGPVPQFMQRRENSATENYKAKGSLTNVSNDLLKASLIKEKAYGAECFTREYLVLSKSSNIFRQNYL